MAEAKKNTTKVKVLPHMAIPNPRVRALRYGGPGTGKTAMLASWVLAIPKVCPVTGKKPWVLVLDYDDGLNVLRDARTGTLPNGILGLYLRDTTQVEGLGSTRMQRDASSFQQGKDLMTALLRAPSPSQFTDTKEYLEACKGWEDSQWVDRIQEYLPTYDPTELTPRPWVVSIDTLTGLHDVAMNLALTLDTQKTGLGGAPAMHHWGAQMRYVDEFMKLCESPDWHTDITCHEAMEKDEITGAILGTILVTGKKTAGLIPGLFDEMYHHEMDRQEDPPRYTIRTRSSGLYAAKSRLGFNMTTGEALLDEHEDVTREPGQELWGWGYIMDKLGAVNKG